MKGYGQARWQRARALALKRAHHRCEVRGPRCTGERNLVVHHRDGKGMTGPRATDLANLIVACRACHNLVHGPDRRRVRNGVAVVVRNSHLG